MGIALAGSSQVIFVDTPGIFQPRRRLDRAMVHAAWSGAEDADRIALVIDAKQGADERAMAIVEGLKGKKLKADLILNKIDLVRRDTLLGLASQMVETGVFADVFMISAETGDGTRDLLAHFAGLVAEGPWHFPEDQVSDMPMRLLAAEITREQIFRQLHEELPYAAAVDTERWLEMDNGSVRIEQIVYIQRESQRAIVLGKGGSRIKSLGAKARAELEEMLERRVHLFLHVKVRENWLDDPSLYRSFGLQFDI